MRRVIVHSKRRVFDGFFKVDEAQVSFAGYHGGMLGPVTRLCFERGDSVAALLYNRDSERLIFVEQFKYPTYERGPGWIMETVAGIPEPDEMPEAAVRREVLEEVGYQLDTLEQIATFYPSPGGSSERVTLYYAEVTDAAKVAAGGGMASEGEDIRVIELSREAVAALLRSGDVHDAKTIIAIQWFQERGRTPSERARALKADDDGS